MISLADYWMGRDAAHPLDMTPAIDKAARLTVSLVNALLVEATSAGVYQATLSPRSGTQLASGWRPPAVNAATKNASPTSLHMTGQAADVYDHGDKLDAWLMQPPGQAALERIGLWLEHPDFTPEWCHLQVIPPGSGRRVFRPR